MQDTHGRDHPSDNPAFNAHQTKQEQLYILADMLYIYKPLWGTEEGPLVDYRAVVKSGSDIIPGRTQDESLEMINRAIEFIISVGAMQEDEARRGRIRNTLFISLALIAFVGMAWLIPHLPQILSH